jgi:hypothetical protein
MDNTTQKKKSILRNIINTVSGAGDTLNNIASTIKANNGINSNINTLAIKAAQKQYKQDNGKNFSQDSYQQDLDSGMLSPDNKQYKNNLNKFSSLYKKKFN